jgi:hypothetical protein
MHANQRQPPVGRRHTKNPATPIRWRGYDQIGWLAVRNYFLERLDAFNGFTFCAVSAMLELTWVARLQLPFFHLAVGSGQAEQYQPELISIVRLHPLHCSTISKHTPPLYPQPLAVMKAHSMPLRTVVHFIVTPPSLVKTNEKAKEIGSFGLYKILRYICRSS